MQERNSRIGAVYWAVGDGIESVKEEDVGQRWMGRGRMKRNDGDGKAERKQRYNAIFTIISIEVSRNC
jgi:hypothetical protein